MPFTLTLNSFRDEEKDMNRKRREWMLVLFYLYFRVNFHVSKDLLLCNPFPVPVSSGYTGGLSLLLFYELWTILRVCTRKNYQTICFLELELKIYFLPKNFFSSTWHFYTLSQRRGKVHLIWINSTKTFWLLEKNICKNTFFKLLSKSLCNLASKNPKLSHFNSILYWFQYLHNVEANQHLIEFLTIYVVSILFVH